MIFFGINYKLNGYFLLCPKNFRMSGKMKAGSIYHHSKKAFNFPIYTILSPIFAIC